MPEAESKPPLVSRPSLPVEREVAHLQPFEPISGESEDEGLNLRAYWRVLVQRKWTVSVVFIITAAITATATFLMTPIYRATTTLQIDREAPKVVKFEVLTPVATNLFDPEFYQTQYELLKSHSLAERVVEQLNLAQHPAFHGRDSSGGFAARAEAQEQPIEARAVLSSLATRLVSSLSVEPVRNSKLVKVHYDSPDPVLAAQIVKSLAELFIRMKLERGFDAASYAKDFLEQRLAQVKAKLEDSEQALVAFARRQGIINVDQKQTLAMEKLQAVSAAVAVAGNERIAAESLYREALAAHSHGLSRILDSETINKLKQIRVELEANYQEQGLILKPEYPKMQQLGHRIREVQTQIEREVGAIHAALRGDYQAAQRKEDMLESNLAAIKEEVLRLQDQSSRYTILRREVDTNRTLYDGLLQRLKEVGVAGGDSMNNISVIDAAEVANSPFKPNVRKNLLFGIVLGLCAGIGLAFLFEHLDDTVKLPEDLERLAQLPILGILPKLQSQAEGALAAHREPRSGIAEAIRSVRQALLFSVPAQETQHPGWRTLGVGRTNDERRRRSAVPRVLQFTSPMQGEGKTTTALNLAIAFTQIGEKVLLVDCDLRRPNLHCVLKLDGSRGLTHYLTNNSITPLDVTQCARIPNLFVIPAGPQPPNPAELLGSTRMVKLLALAAEKFDYVLLDGPPTLGLADALILANLARGTVMVVEAAVSRHRHVIGALKRLASARVTVLGGVLNKLDRHDSAYSCYHNHYYYATDEARLERLPARSDPVKPCVAKA